MLNDSVTTPLTEGDTNSTLVAFQSAVAKYRFNSETPLKKITLCEGESPRHRKHKNNEDEAATKKKKRPKRGYAEPERYAHLNQLPDVLGHRLDVLFCGIKSVRFSSGPRVANWLRFESPGEHSATIGHHFANPRNHFWRCLFEAGLTVNHISAREDHTLPGLKPFSLGLTNLVDRPTAEESELSDAELTNSIPAFLEKITKYRPCIVCIVGLGIAKTVKARCLPKGTDGRNNVNVGFQSYKLVHGKEPDLDVRETLFYAMPSTSARVVHFQKGDKVRIMKEMRDSLASIKQGMFDTSKMHPVRGEVFDVDLDIAK